MNPRNNPMHRRPSSRLLAVAAAAQAPIAPRPVEPPQDEPQGERLLKNVEIQKALSGAIDARAQRTEVTESPASNLDEVTK
ncbi:hypothetical protein [Magnetospirillum molischianum]|uniref:Uncharacterized protein n=1 Tax=Magnetospirillum molischianum DSM 120 TaxID=1150626 RepID=H8FTW2_MAGML|nr:hypothetical protein [Magnetospirillum molischianum]CCG41819.1 exported hypothetical protein [Magnetospirillum molischianum DSM 120]